MKDIINKFRNAKDLLDEIDWTSKSFSLKKAYVCSLYSKLAYLHIQEFEMNRSSRVSLVPCLEFQEVIQNQEDINIEMIIQESNLESEGYITIETAYAVVVAIKYRNIIFVSIRGTELFNFYDWRANLNAKKANPLYEDRSQIRFHKGFYTAISNIMGTIYHEISDRFGDDNIIYVTGHSLGGALAAILHALWSKSLISHYPYSPNINKRQQITHSCYTFGMPRYGTKGAMQYFSNPFHVYNKKDVVPFIPPKWLGYADGYTEYCLSPSSIENIEKRKSLSIISDIYGWSRFIVKRAKYHNIEEYNQLILSRLI